jgi:hypothetical protein
MIELSLYMNYVEDPSGGFTTWFSLFPQIVAEGETIEEATQNLVALVNAVSSHGKTLYGDLEQKAKLSFGEKEVKFEWKG